MKKTLESQGNMSCNGGVVFASGRKSALGAKNGIETPQDQRKTEGGARKWLAEPWRGEKITGDRPRRPRAGTEKGNPNEKYRERRDQ